MLLHNITIGLHTGFVLEIMNVKTYFNYQLDAQFLYSVIYITLNTSACFEQYYAHLQEVKIVFLQHLVSSLSVKGRAVHRLRAEDEHSIARNMSRYLM
jgi:hypothetical protein